MRQDSLTDKRYERRKQWVITHLRELSEVDAVALPVFHAVEAVYFMDIHP